MSDTATTEKRGWFRRLRDGLARTSSKIAEGIGAIFTKRRLDDAQLDELETLLIQADLGPAAAARLVAGLRKTRFGQEVSAEEVRAYLAEEIARSLAPAARALVPDRARRPHVVLVVGVNGSGKTTTIGKLAKAWRAEGRRIVIAAGDTFRAAAVEQLQVWGERAGVPVVAGAPGADAAGLAYDALARAKAENADVLIVDTAGRLQNKAGLMEELRKIIRVLRKLDPDAPHDCVLVLDATVGQNAHQQVEVFKDMVGVTGLVMTKLDGTAKGGVVVALAERFGLPVYAVGVGEGADDLRPFDAGQFARGLMGLEAAP
ncbi:MAG: signal recognition particle-docking protein FtsY [Alphaproteobacteria bacterium]|nr:signal recognition particle-docking protein FtsY [Alphaproteobacteria bacterium]